jgi:nitroreductase
MQFVVVKDAAKRQAIAEIYAKGWALYRTLPNYAGAVQREGAEQAQQVRVVDSATYLADNMAKCPVLIIACHNGNRLDGVPAMMSASALGNILPATWSFMLAARARGLGTAWTTIHLIHEKEVAEVLGIPFDTVQQVCMTPLAYTKGTDFKPAMRPDPDTILHWDSW